MKRIIALPVFLLFLALSSCDLVDQIVPDVDQVVTQTYNISIDANVPAGATEEVFIDITQYDEYKNYSQYITGYKVNKVTYKILDYDAPEDLYFSGEIVAFDESNVTEVTVGSVPSINLSNVASMDEEKTLGQEDAAYEQVVNWLDDPGNFNIKFDFGFEKSDGSDYDFAQEDIGSTFKLEVSFYLTILTGV